MHARTARTHARTGGVARAELGGEGGLGPGAQGPRPGPGARPGVLFCFGSSRSNPVSLGIGLDVLSGIASLGR